MLWPAYTERWPDRVPAGMDPAFPTYLFGTGQMPTSAVTSGTHASVSGEIARKCLTVREIDGMTGA